MVVFGAAPFPIMYRHARTLLAVLALTVPADPSSAQPSSPNFVVQCDVQDRLSEDHLRCTGRVEFEQQGLKLYADEVEIFVDEHRVLATGNVVFTQGNNRIAGDRAELDTETRLGTFFNASGIANIQPPRPRATTGLVAPALAGQDTDVYFFGETVEKIGPKKYRITNGGFTTCVQPTPRWNLHADSVVLNIDHYTLLRNAVFNVKGVPLLYLPIFYYPTKEEDRATGFLIPTYGASSLRGQTISNAFFWAMNRSQDATVMHDWFSRTGQGLGSEYRYNVGSGDGNVRTYLLDQSEATYVQANGAVLTIPGARSYEIRGGGNQQLPGNLRARGRVDYFSSITTMQTFNTNVYDASRSQRSIGGNVAGAWRTYTLNGTFDRNEYFYNSTDSVLSGSTPRVSFNRNERPLFPGAQVYFSFGSEFAHLARESRTTALTTDSSLSRLDFSPQVRYPFKRWQWFTVNSSVAWRDTYYSRSLDPDTIDPRTGRPAIVEDNVNRRYYTLVAQTVGPVLNRIWNTPDNGYAERFKHTIEPFLNVQRTSSIERFDRIVQTDGIDGVVGSATSYTYGLRNRLYAKRRPAAPGQTAQAQEILSVEVVQSYYSDENLAQYDRQYATTGIGAPPSHFSPLLLGVRATPAPEINATLRAEFDSTHRELRTLSVAGDYNWAGRLQASVGWSQRYFIGELPGFNDPNALDHYLNVSTNARTRDNRVGSIYSLNYDVLRSRMLQQRISAFYNAQCCGIAFEYQHFNFGGISGFGIPADRRFFLSFTLAGLGNFSPFNGAMGNVPR
jgi:LPS-assembly protein